jgi:exopolysaccharide production protein ExoZ
MTDLLRALADKFEINRGGKDNLRPLEGLRGFAMIAVFMAHYVVHAQPFLVAQSDT